MPENVKPQPEETVTVEVEVPKSQLEAATKPAQTSPEAAAAPDSDKPTVAGYTVGDVVSAPIKTPHPDNREAENETISKAQPTVVSRICIIIAIGLAVLGLLFFAVSVGVGIFLLVLAALVAAAGIIIEKLGDR